MSHANSQLTMSASVLITALLISRARHAGMLPRFDLPQEMLAAQKRIGELVFITELVAPPTHPVIFLMGSLPRFASCGSGQSDPRRQPWSRRENAHGDNSLPRPGPRRDLLISE